MYVQNMIINVYLSFQSEQWKIYRRKGFNQFAFLICSWRFLMSYKIEQLEFKLEKNIRI